MQAITTAVVGQVFESYVHKHVTVCMYVQDTNTHEQVYIGGAFEVKLQ